VKANIITVLILLAIGAAAVSVVWTEFQPNADALLLAPGDKLVMLLMYAEWSESSKRMNPLIEEISEEMKERLSVIKINVDEHEELAWRFGVEAVPCVIVMKDGVELRRSAGRLTKSELRKLTGL
jgi:thioredoxin 1